MFSGAFDASAQADESGKSGSGKGGSGKSGSGKGLHPLEPATSHSVARAPPPTHTHELVERAANWLRDEGVAEWPHARASAVRMLASLLLARMAKKEEEASGADAADGADAWVASAVAVMQERLHGAPPRAAATRKEQDEQQREQAGGGQLPLVFQLLAPPPPLPGIYI